MKDSEMENNLESPLIEVAARANELALQVSILRDRTNDASFSRYLTVLHDVLYGYAVDVYYTLSGQRHKHSDMVNARYHMHNAIPRLVQILAEQFSDLDVLTDNEHDFVLDVRDTLILARRHFREGIRDFEQQLRAHGPMHISRVQ
jgi:hypothetical protein